MKQDLEFPGVQASGPQPIDEPTQEEQDAYDRTLPAMPSAPPKLGTLYEIGLDLMALEELVTEIGGDVSDEDIEATIDAWLAETGEAQKTKVDRYVQLIREMLVRAEGRAKEATRLAALAGADKRGAERLEQRLLEHFLRTKTDELQTHLFKIKVVRNGGKRSLKLLVAAEQMPAQLRIEEIVYKADTEHIRKIAEDAKAPDDQALPIVVDGQRVAVLEPRGKRLSIR